MGDQREYLEEIGPIDVDGHSVRAFVQTHGVSAAGPAVPSNPQWIVEIDGRTQIGAGLEGRYDDTEPFVRPYIEDAVRSYLAGQK